MHKMMLYSHLATVLPCIPIGTYLLLTKNKGSNTHKLWGKIWAVLMFATALATVPLQAKVGPTLFNHFGLLHIFTVITLWRSRYIAIYARRGNMKRHKSTVYGLYVALWLTFLGATLAPGRFLYELLFN